MNTESKNKRHQTVIHRLLHDPGFPLFRVWITVINALIYLSCLSIALESIDAVGAEYKIYFRGLEIVAVVFFSVDYAFNIFAARDRVRYVTSFWGIIDLLSIIPSVISLFNMTSVRGAKVLRLLRVIRILRVLKLIKAAAADVASAQTGKSNKLATNLRIYFIALFTVLMISSSLMFFSEGSLYTADVIAAGQAALDKTLVAKGVPAGKEIFSPTDPISGAPIPPDKRFFTSIPESMWWCITTLTTTGYGDEYPVTVMGRVLAAFTMLAGLVLFGMLMNIVGKALMLMLFGENIEDHVELVEHADKLRASLRLMNEAGIISLADVERISRMPLSEISSLMTGYQTRG